MFRLGTRSGRVRDEGVRTMRGGRRKAAAHLWSRRDEVIGRLVPRGVETARWLHLCGKQRVAKARCRPHHVVVTAGSEQPSSALPTRSNSLDDRLSASCGAGALMAWLGASETCRRPASAARASHGRAFGMAACSAGGARGHQSAGRVRAARGRTTSAALA